MAHNQRFNTNNDEKYDPEATDALRQILASHLQGDRLVAAIKKEIRRGADPHILLEPTPRPAYLDNNMVWEPNIPLESLASFGEADFLQELFAMGLEPTRNMLINAIKSTRNTIRTIDAILDEDPNLINAMGDDGLDKSTTPLIAALKKNLDESIIEHLLKRGANPDLQAADGRTPLMYATKLRKSVIELLLRYGADTQLENKQGRLAHSYAKSQVMKGLLPNRQGGRRKTRRHKRKARKSRKARKTSKRH